MSFPAKIPVILVTLILLLYTYLVLKREAVSLTGFIFTISPFLLVWLVISVLLDTKTTVQEFREGQEWGYADREE